MNNVDRLAATVSYDPSGTGDNHGIIYCGDLKVLIKAIKLLDQRGFKFPINSHHGTCIRLKDYKFNLSIGNVEDFKTENCITGTRFVFSANHWENTISPYGHTEYHEAFMKKTEKNGLKKMLEDNGFEIMNSWNDDRDGISVSMVSHPIKFGDKKTYKTDILLYLKAMSDILEVRNLYAGR